MNWEPKDIIRLTALVGGFVLCGVGGVLMWLGVGAEGSVDIKSSVLTGTVKTGSAGLFTLFFGFGIIIFVLASLSAKMGGPLTEPQRRSRVRHIGYAFAGELVAFLVMATLGATGYGQGFGAAAFFLGLLLLITGGAYLVQLESEHA